MEETRKNISLYVHIPFCVQKCVYCDFLSFPACPAAEQIRYFTALNQEIRLYRPFADRYVVKTIYFGGGTPSLPDPALIEDTLKTIRSVFFLDRFPGITLEANPGTIRYSSLRSLREAGVNRLSIGMQSGDDAILKTLGRIHTYTEFLDGYDAARRAGFRNISVDVMSGVPGQSIHSYADTLQKVTALRPEHISSYSLQVEEGTPLSQDQALLSRIPDEDTDRKMYAMTKRILAAAGYHRYEISNYALPGYESRHNSIYWTGGEYLGFGIGAASLFRGKRFSNIRDRKMYIRLLSEEENKTMESEDKTDRGNGAALRKYEKVTAKLRENVTPLYIDDRMEEFMFLGLRMTEGVSRQDFKARFGRDMFEVYGSVINRYTDTGYMACEGDRVRLTDAGIDVSNYILSDFILTA